MKSTIISSTTDNLDLITIASSNVTLKDFHLKGTTAGTGTDLLIYLQTGCKHFRAERVRATDTLEEAFYIYDADYSQLVDCEAYSVRTGVSISSSDYIQIWGGSYHDCSSPNLYVVNSEYTMINGVSCYNGANYNARFSTSGNMTIANCMFKDGASSGIFVDASRNSSFTGCFFLDNADNGALVNGNSGNTGFNTFIGCHFKGNTGDGIELGGVTVPVATVIDGCSFINNGANINDGGAGTITGDNALG